MFILVESECKSVSDKKDYFTSTWSSKGEEQEKGVTVEDNDAEWAQLKKVLEKSRVQKIRKKFQKQNQMT